VLPSLHRVPWVGSPASSVLRSTPTSCRPSRVASFPSLRGTAAPWVSLPQTQDATPAGQGFSPESPNRFMDGGNRTSQVPAGPTMSVPCSPTPAGPLRSATAALRCCLPPFGRRRLPRLPNISRLDHTARTSAVYASQGGLPHRHARLASGGWPTLPGGTGYPPGPNERFQVIPSSFPRLRLAHPKIFELAAAGVGR